MTYNPFLYHLGQTIWKNLFLLYQDQQVRRVVTPASFVSFRTARTLRTHQVRTKVYAAEKKGLLGQVNILETVVIVQTGTFQSFVNKKANKINHRFTCRDKSLVYLLSCKVCERIYTDQTVDEFRYRWNNYKNNNRESLRGG